MERRKLITENDLVEAPAQTCINCAGLRYIDGVLCGLCEGEGKIVVDYRPIHIPRLMLLKIGVALILAGAAIAFAASYWQELKGWLS